MFLIILLVALLLQVSFVVSDSILKTLKEQRLDAYGAFKYYFDSADRQSVSRGEFARHIGEITLLGESGGAEIGFLDEEAESMGRLSLINGSLPKEKGEIAVEAGFLLSMGYSYDLLQEIVIPVTAYIKDGDPVEAEMSFTLCGVLENYSSVWGFGPRAIVSPPDMVSFGVEVSPKYLYLVDEQLTQQILKDKGVSDSIKENLSAYPKGSLTNFSTILLYIVLMICIISAGLLFMILLFSVKKREESWRFLRSTGAAKNCLQLIVLWEGILLGAIALPIGSVIGFAFGLLCVFSFNIQVDLQVAHILLALCIATLTTIVGVLAASFFVRNTPLLHREHSHKVPKKSNKEYGEKAFTALGLFLSRVRTGKAVAIGIFGVIFSCGLITALMLHMTSSYTSEIIQMQRLSLKGDFVLDNTNGLFGDYAQIITGKEENLPVSENIINQIKDIYGVDEISAYKLSNLNNTVNYFNANRQMENFGGTANMFTLNLEPYAQNNYYKAVELGQRSRAAQTLAYEREIMGAQEMRDFIGTEWGGYITYDLAVEEVDKSPPLLVEDFAADSRAYPITVMSAAQGVKSGFPLPEKDTCTVILPDLYLKQKMVNVAEELPTINGAFGVGFDKYDTGCDKVLIPMLFADGTREKIKLQGYSAVTESEMQVGDMLSVSFAGETREIAIGKIIRTLPKDMSYYPITALAPYTLIVEEDFFAGYNNYPYKDRYDCVTLKASENGNRHAIDGQMSKVVASLKSSEYVYTNLSSRVDNVISEAVINIGIFLLFLILYLVAAFIILSRIFTFALQGTHKKIAVLRAIGMERKLLLRSYRLESVFYCVTGYVAAAIAMFGIWGVNQFNSYGGKMPVSSLLFSDGCLDFPWLVFLGFAILNAVIVALLYYLPVRRLVNNSIINQLAER